MRSGLSFFVGLGYEIVLRKLRLFAEVFFYGGLGWVSGVRGGDAVMSSQVVGLSDDLGRKGALGKHGGLQETTWGLQTGNSNEMGMKTLTFVDLAGYQPPTQHFHPVAQIQSVMETLKICFLHLLVAHNIRLALLHILHRSNVVHVANDGATAVGIFVADVRLAEAVELLAADSVQVDGEDE
jgi:hypothetical protein